MRSVTGLCGRIPSIVRWTAGISSAYAIRWPGAHARAWIPARMILPGLYGMKNVKWLSGIEVVDNVFAGYWDTAAESIH